MAIELETPKAAGRPVVKRTAIGEQFAGMLVRKEQRNVLKDGEPVMNERGRPKQELVLTCMALDGCTAPAGIGDHQAVPTAGEVVRLILRGKSFADWIQLANDLGVLQVGDVVSQVTDSAQAYDASGKPTGRPMTTQDELDAALRKRQTVGVYGTIGLRRATTQEAALVQRAEQLWAETSKPIALDDSGDDEPF